MSNLHQELVRRFYEIAYVQHKLDEAKKHLADGYVLYDPARPGFGSGPEEWKRAQKIYLDAIPDHHLEVIRQVAEGDLVTTHWRTTGTHQRDLPGIPATNKRINIQGITISRVVDGKIAEEWQVWDFYDFLNQLGVVQAPSSILRAA